MLRVTVSDIPCIVRIGDTVRGTSTSYPDTAGVIYPLNCKTVRVLLTLVLSLLIREAVNDTTSLFHMDVLLAMKQEIHFDPSMLNHLSDQPVVLPYQPIWFGMIIVQLAEDDHHWVLEADKMPLRHARDKEQMNKTASVDRVNQT